MVFGKSLSFKDLILLAMYSMSKHKFFVSKKANVHEHVYDLVSDL